MRTSVVVLTGALAFATSTFAQAKASAESSRPVTESRPVVETRPPVQVNNRLRAHFGNSCCLSLDSTQSSGDSVSPFASVEIVHAQGGPDWQPSNFMTFPQAVSVGQQEAALTPGHQANPAMVQQMLELIQQVRIAKDQNRADGNSGPVKWADLKPALDPADYRRPPSTFMDYQQALALGEDAEAHPKDPDQMPSLGDVARDERESKPANEKATVVIKQNADGSPVIVQKKP